MRFKSQLYSRYMPVCIFWLQQRKGSPNSNGGLRKQGLEIRVQGHWGGGMRPEASVKKKLCRKGTTGSLWWYSQEFLCCHFVVVVLFCFLGFFFVPKLCCTFKGWDFIRPGKGQPLWVLNNQLILLLKNLFFSEIYTLPLRV